MKKLLAILMIAAMLSSFACLFSGVFALEGETITVGSAEDLVDTIAEINEGYLPTDTNITLTADIDGSSLDSWKPLVSYDGVFDGAGHTISGLSSTIVIANNNEQSVDGGKGNNFYRWSGVNPYPDPPTENLYGECGMAVLAVKLTGTVKNLTLSEGEISLQANFNKNNLMDLAYLVGYADGATFENITLSGITVTTVGKGVNENQGYLGYTGIIAGRATGDVTFKDITIDDTCTVNTADTPRMDGAEILGGYKGEGTVLFDNCKSEATVTLCTDSSITCMWGNGVRTDGVAGEEVKFVSENGTLIFGSQLTLEDGKEYSFYYQTRQNADDATAVDYRILCVASTDWASSLKSVSLSMSFTDGNETRSTVESTTTVYKSVTATGEGYTDLYRAEDGTVIFGWVVVGVPAAFASNQPTVAIVE